MPKFNMIFEICDERYLEQNQGGTSPRGSSRQDFVISNQIVFLVFHPGMLSKYFKKKSFTKDLRLL